MKQHLRIKKFLGTSQQSVKAQILVALIAYLLVHILKYSMKSDISMPDAMAVIGTLLLLKEPLSRLLGRLPHVTQNMQLASFETTRRIEMLKLIEIGALFLSLFLPAFGGV